MVQNKAPEPETYCVDPVPARNAPVIRFPGGVQIEVAHDPTIGPDACAYAANLATAAQGALAPFGPIITVIDLAASAVQFLLAVKDLPSPSAVRKILKLTPGLVEKLNKLLALVPAFPQGIVAYVQLVVDVVGLAIESIDCAISSLQSVQRMLDEVARLRERLEPEVLDEALSDALSKQIQSCEEDAVRATKDALSSLSVIGRLLCVIRIVLSMIPGGDALQARLAFPDPLNLVDLGRAIETLQALRDGLQAVVEALVALTGGLGLQIGAEPFVCPLDAATTPEPRVIPPTPTIQLCRDTFGAVVTLLPVIPGGSGAEFLLRVIGKDFQPNTQIYCGTTVLREIARVGDVISCGLPASLRSQAGAIEIRAVSKPTGGAAPAFSGLDGPDGESGDSGVRLSDPWIIGLDD